MSETAADEPYIRLAQWVDEGRSESIDALLEELSPSEVARAISRLDEVRRARLLGLLEPGDAADLVEELSDLQGAEILEDLPVETAAAIVHAMESNERADVLAELSDDDAEAILREMQPDTAEEARRLLGYDPHTAGGLMVTEYVVYPQHWTVGDVLNDLRSNAEAYADYGVQYAYVQADSGALVGVLRLRDLLLSRADRPIRDVMIANPISVTVNAGVEELEQVFDRYMFSGLPVVGPAGDIVGVVSRADVEEAHGEMAERRFMRFSGVIGEDILRSAPLYSRSISRLGWLVLNLCLTIPAAFVILSFERTIDKTIALAALIPILGNLSGCSGNQAVAVSIREMTLGIIRPRDVFRVARQEAGVGIVNGIVLGILLASFAVMLGGGAALGMAVGLAMSLNTILAVVLGGTIPLVLKRFGVDPAVASSPFLTTAADVVGFFLILSLATIALQGI
jgi:magnesium transporter